MTGGMAGSDHRDVGRPGRPTVAFYLDCVVV